MAIFYSCAGCGNSRAGDKIYSCGNCGHTYCEACGGGDCPKCNNDGWFSKIGYIEERSSGEVSESPADDSCLEELVELRAEKRAREIVREKEKEAERIRRDDEEIEKWSKMTSEDLMEEHAKLHQAYSITDDPDRKARLGDKLDTLSEILERVLFHEVSEDEAAESGTNEKAWVGPLLSRGVLKPRREVEEMSAEEAEREFDRLLAILKEGREGDRLTAGEILEINNEVSWILPQLQSKRAGERLERWRREDEERRRNG